MDHFEADHRRRLDDSVALLSEMLTTSDEEALKILDVALFE